MSEAAPQDLPINSLGVLLAHALAMESEAVDRYGELADQMEMHRKKDVASIFRRLAKAEQKHLDELEEMCADMDLPHIAPWDFKWGGESPEAIAVDRVSYQMSVKGAVLLALDHEKKAYGFYSRVANQTSDSEIRRLARQFADEELHHVAWLEEWRDKCGPNDELPLDDPDPPLSQE